MPNGSLTYYEINCVKSILFFKVFAPDCAYCPVNDSVSTAKVNFYPVEFLFLSVLTQNFFRLSILHEICVEVAGIELRTSQSRVEILEKGFGCVVVLLFSC